MIRSVSGVVESHLLRFRFPSVVHSNASPIDESLSGAGFLVGRVMSCPETELDGGKISGNAGSLVVLGIEGRSVVGNLRIVVSRSTRLAGWAMLCIYAVAGWASAQDAEPAKPAPEPPAAAPATSVPVAYAPPRITDADEKTWRSTQQLKFSSALKSLAPTNAETKVLIDAANHYVDKMTIPKYLPDLYRNAIDPTKRLPEGPLTQAKPREILLKAITARVVDLLAENPPHHPDVQLGLVLLLGSLNAQLAGTNTVLVPYTGSYKALIGVLENNQSPLQCRIHAAIGLGRMGREAAVGVPGGDLSVLQRSELAAALAKVLVATESQDQADGQVWFRCRVAESLGDCGVAFDLNGGSGFIDALMATATNPAEHLRVRALALRATTQLGWNGSTNVPLILHETMELLLEVAQGYNAAIAAHKRLANADFQHANFDLYLCFMPKTAIQANVLKWGMLNQVTRPTILQHGPAVKSAYAVALPVINHIVANPKTPVAVPAALIAALQTWLKENAPKERKTTTVSPKALP